MRVKVTTIQYMEVCRIDDEETPFDEEDFKDSYVDHLLDGQDTLHQTSDDKFEYYPREFVVNVEEEENAG